MNDVTPKMYQPAFFPADKFSKEMLISIPRKVGTWLVNLTQEPEGSYGDLTWSFSPVEGTIGVGKGDGDELVIIMWEGDIAKPDTLEICGSAKQFERIGENLSFFVEVEQQIYRELDNLQRQINEKSSSERFILKTTPPRGDEPQGEPEPIILNAAERFAAQMRDG